MSQWFRLYAEAVDDPKVQMLPAEMFKAWINILCVACRGGGKIGIVSELAFTLRCAVEQAESTLLALEKHGLLHRVSNQHGTTWAPHNWEKRQFKGEPDFRRSSEWSEIRMRIFTRDDFTCAYCGVRGERMECDHIVPIARGGSHDDENLTTACKPCNQSKRDKLLSEWLS